MPTSSQTATGNTPASGNAEIFTIDYTDDLADAQAFDAVSLAPSPVQLLTPSFILDSYAPASTAVAATVGAPEVDNNSNQVGVTPLFAQGSADVPIESLAAGMNLPAGLSLTLWSHDGTPYPLSPVNLDPSSLTGVAAGSGSELLGVSPDTADSTLAQVSNGGAEIGAIIDSNDLLDGGAVPDGPMPLMLEWVAPKSIMPFANSTDGGLLLQADIQVPYVMQQGFQSTVTSAQIVLYLDLHDTTTGANLAYGLTVFDSRGTSTPYFGVDDGTGGTGATIVTAPAGQTSPYDVLVPGTAAFQGGPWTGWQTFALMITPATLEAAIAAANARNPRVNLSTNVANYELINVSVDAELEYFGQPNTLSYSVSNLQVAEVQDPASVTVAMLPPVVEVPPPQTPQQAAATPISGISLSESGAVAGETFTVALSDSYGDLSVNATGVTLGGLGNNSTDLTITGTLNAVNTALATLSDTDAVALPDTITLSANDSFGNSSVQQQITVDPRALLTNIQVPQFPGPTELAPCFLRGTRILTERGEIPVEALRAGEDRVITRDGRPAQVVWIGWRELDLARHPRAQDVMPVRVLAGALAPGQPRRDLRLSPDHALALGGVLIPVRYLLNGATVVQEAWPGRIAYYHVELDRHDILLADGAAAESYLDTGNRGAFANGGPAGHMHHPDFALEVWEAEACAPLVLDGHLLVAAKRRLLSRAAALGHATTDDSGLRVLADGRELAAETDGRRWCVRVPEATENVHLTSRVWSPAHTRPTGDTRLLGVAIARLWLDRREVSLESLGLSSGWHAPEQGWRWTAGDADLALAGVHELAFEVAMTGTYWLEERLAAPRAAACPEFVHARMQAALTA